MKCTTVIDPSREEEVIIYAKKVSEPVSAIERICAAEDSPLAGYDGKSAVMLDLADVVCFTVEDGHVFAVTRDAKLSLKVRLYQVEERLDNSFIRINQSCIANISMIKKFDASVTGTLKVIFKGGYTDYVSRRNVRKVKERLGL